MIDNELDAVGDDTEESSSCPLKCSIATMISMLGPMGQRSPNQRFKTPIVYFSLSVVIVLLMACRLVSLDGPELTIR